MWLFMYVCYLMGVLTYLMFLLSGLQGIFKFPLLGAPHPTFAFLTSIIYLFTQTLTIFFFVGTSSNIREYLESQPEAPARTDLAVRARFIRGAVSGQIYLNILLFLVQAILGGAVAARAVPRFLHGTMVAVAFPALPLRAVARASRIQGHHRGGGGNDRTESIRSTRRVTADPDPRPGPPPPPPLLLCARRA